MKKLLVLVIMLCVYSFSNSQEVSYGVKAGVNLSDWHFSVSNYNDVYDMRIAYHVGAVVEIGFSDKFSVQPELLYSSVGCKVNASEIARESAPSSDINYIANYLSIPVLAKYYVAEGFSVELGPQLSILMGAKASNDDDSEDIKDELESIDFGAGIGASYKMENGLFLNARYIYGLSNVIKDFGDETAKNNVFQFSLGYKFN